MHCPSSPQVSDKELLSEQLHAAEIKRNNSLLIQYNIRAVNYVTYMTTWLRDVHNSGQHHYFIIIQISAFLPCCDHTCAATAREAIVTLQARGTKRTGHTRFAAAFTGLYVAFTAISATRITLAGKAAHATLYIVMR